MDNYGSVNLGCDSESACFRDTPYNSHSGGLEARNSRKYTFEIMDIKVTTCKIICDSKNKQFLLLSPT